MALGQSELEKFEAEVARIPIEAPAGKKNGKPPEKLPAITAEEATETKFRAIIEAGTVQASQKIAECRAALNALEQELLQSAAKQAEGFASHIQRGQAIAKETERLTELVQELRAEHARVVGSN